MRNLLITYETLFETIANIERQANRLIVFEQKIHEYRYFPRLSYSGGDHITLYVNIPVWAFEY